MSELFRHIPSVDASLSALEQADPAFVQRVPRAVLRDAVTQFWDSLRTQIRAGACSAPDQLALARQLPFLLKHARRAVRPRFSSVINGTGVVVHTNMGRSPLAAEARQAVLTAAEGYCNVELDMHTGGRGSRHALTEGLLCRLTGAESALVVNNNAAAVFLVLDTLCNGGEVVVSRGELVEIGGSFRIPDVMKKSGVTLREVGTTNRTHLQDYRDAVGENTRALMRVHASNYRIVGFHSAVALKELADLAHAHGLPLINDLGSGCLVDFSTYGLPGEPVASSVLAEGADVITFSGDKALGGPQAGIVAGRGELIQRIKRNPLARVLRCDKLCLAALEATLRLYLDPDEAWRRVPTLRMAACSREEMHAAARGLASRLRRLFSSHAVPCRVELRSGVSRMGGGAFPQYDLPTMLVCLRPQGCSATALKDALLATDPPVLGRLENDAFCLDPRTLEKREYPLLLRAVRLALEENALLGNANNHT